MACGEPLRVETPSALLTKTRRLPSIRSILFQILGPILRIEFWIDRPSVWSRKVRHLHVSGWCLAISGCRSHPGASPRSAQNFPGPLRYACGLTLVFFLIT